MGKHVPSLLLICIFFLIFSSCKSSINSKIRYTVITASTIEPHSNSVDIYNASQEEIRKMDLVHYSKKFGQVNTEREAVDIAAVVFDEIYSNCSKEEQPFTVYFNKNADAWIVQGTLKKNKLGGVASTAIDKDSGELIMLFHTK